MGMGQNSQNRTRLLEVGFEKFESQVRFPMQDWRIANECRKFTETHENAEEYNKLDENESMEIHGNALKCIRTQRNVLERVRMRRNAWKCIATRRNAVQALKMLWKNHKKKKLSLSHAITAFFLPENRSSKFLSALQIISIPKSNENSWLIRKWK